MPNILIIDIIFQIFFMSRPQVNQPMADTKVIQKDPQNLKRRWSAIQLLWGGQQCCMETLYMHRSY